MYLYFVQYEQIISTARISENREFIFRVSVLRQAQYPLHCPCHARATWKRPIKLSLTLSHYDNSALLKSLVHSNLSMTKRQVRHLRTVEGISYSYCRFQLRPLSSARLHHDRSVGIGTCTRVPLDRCRRIKWDNMGHLGYANIFSCMLCRTLMRCFFKISIGDALRVENICHHVLITFSIHQKLSDMILPFLLAFFCQFS